MYITKIYFLNLQLMLILSVSCLPYENYVASVGYVLLTLADYAAYSRALVCITGSDIT